MVELSVLCGANDFFPFNSYEPWIISDHHAARRNISCNVLSPSNIIIQGFSDSNVNVASSSTKMFEDADSSTSSHINPKDIRFEKSSEDPEAVNQSTMSVDHLQNSLATGTVCRYLYKKQFLKETFSNDTAFHQRIFSVKYLLKYIFLDVNSVTVAEFAQFLHIYNVRYRSIFRDMKKNIINYLFFSSLRRADQLAHQANAIFESDDEEWYPEVDASYYDEAQKVWDNLSTAKKVTILRFFSRTAFTLALDLYPQNKEKFERVVYLKKKILSLEKRGSRRIPDTQNYSPIRSFSCLPSRAPSNTKTTHIVMNHPRSALDILQYHPDSSKESVDPHRLWLALLHSQAIGSDQSPSS